MNVKSRLSIIALTSAVRVCTSLIDILPFVNAFLMDVFVKPIRISHNPPYHGIRFDINFHFILLSFKHTSMIFDSLTMFWAYLDDFEADCGTAPCKNTNVTFILSWQQLFKLKLTLSVQKIVLHSFGFWDVSTVLCMVRLCFCIKLILVVS